MVIDLHPSDFRAWVTGPAAILAELRLVFPCSSPESVRGPGDHPPVVAIEIVAEQPSLLRYDILDGGQVRWSGLPRDTVIPILEWMILDASVNQLGTSHLLFHAGAVVRRGQGLLLPAVSGRGKTTLTAALIAEGFSLCSDEMGMIELLTGQLVTFPRSLRIRAGSYAALSTRYPRLFQDPVCQVHGVEPAWYLQPSAAVWNSSPVPVRSIVFPRYVPGAPTNLTSITRPTALPLLLDHALSAQQLRAVGMERLVAIVQQADCYMLTVGDDLAEAAAQLRGLSD